MGRDLFRYNGLKKLILSVNLTWQWEGAERWGQPPDFESVKMHNYEMHRSNLFPRLTLVNEWLLSLVTASLKQILPLLQVPAFVYTNSTKELSQNRSHEGIWKNVLP